MTRTSSKLLLGNKGAVKIRATLVSGEGDLLSYTNGKDLLENSTLDSDKPVGIEMQPDALAFGSLSADTAPTTSGFPVNNDECDLDWPTQGFASIPEAIKDIRHGKVAYFLHLLYYHILLKFLFLIFFIVFHF